MKTIKMMKAMVKEEKKTSQDYSELIQLCMTMTKRLKMKIKAKNPKRRKKRRRSKNFIPKRRPMTP